MYQQYVFDGSFEGLMCAVFDWFERRPGTVQLCSVTAYQPSLLVAAHQVPTDAARAARVWKGLQQRLNTQGPAAYYAAWLSGDEAVFRQLFGMALYVLQAGPGADADYGHPDVLAVSQASRKVYREKHRMEAFVRFQQTADGLYYALIRPDFNVLPLIAAHFRDRYAGQSWLIYDQKRRYGLYYDQQELAEVQLEWQGMARPGAGQSRLVHQLTDPKEALYAQLWQDYFSSANIPARNNPALHLRHVPKRYWSYLTEKWPGRH